MVPRYPFSCQRRRLNRKVQSIAVTLKRLRSEKNALLRKVREAKQQNCCEDALKLISTQFHKLICQHSKMKQALSKAQSKFSAIEANKLYKKNFWSFSKSLLEDEMSNVAPNFSAEEEYQFFSSTYSKPSNVSTNPFPSDFCKPNCPEKSFDIRLISYEEVYKKIRSTRNHSAPSPLDGIPYIVLKKCQSLIPALLNLFNNCWLSCTVPRQWKVGVIRLIPKSSATESPSDPINFRPIALTPCIRIQVSIKLFCNRKSHQRSFKIAV